MNRSLSGWKGGLEVEQKFRKRWLCVFMLLCGILLCGCGREEEKSAPAEYYELSSVNKRLFDSKKEGEEKDMLLGMQFYQGEPVQLWSGLGSDSVLSSVFLWRQDGSREILLENVADAASMQWYIEEEGDFYCWSSSWSMALNGEEAVSIRKLDASGEEVFHTSLDPGIELKSLRQLADGRVVLLIRDEGGYKLAELDPGRGSVTQLDGKWLDQRYGTYYIASGEQGLLVLNDGMSGGICEINIKDGSRILDIPFMGMNYSVGARVDENMELRDLHIQEDGTVAMLWVDPEKGKGTQETLQMEKVDKIPVVLRTTLLMDGGWLEGQVSEFNRISDIYHVIVEYPDPAQQAEYKEMTRLEISVGKGPDILYGYMFDGMQELFRQGCLEDLAPYMEADGMLEEDYFPAAFSGYRDGDKIYTVRAQWVPGFSCIDRTLLGDGEEPDIERLVDALLAWEEDAVYGSLPSSWIMQEFLEGSVDFWGMLDWKAGSCDFSGELFAKMLEVSKRYGYSWDEIYAEKFHDWPNIRGGVNCRFYDYDTLAELEAKNLVRCGTLFEDGCYASYSDHEWLFAVNSNSPAKQGAWEFLRYAMDENAQKTISLTIGNPTNRAAFAEKVEEELKKLAGGYKYSVSTNYQGQDGEWYSDVFVRGQEDITPEYVEEYIRVLEDSRDLSANNARVHTIMQIIQEEAEYYFKGEKSIQETVDIIHNRVNLYMGEQK